MKVGCAVPHWWLQGFWWCGGMLISPVIGGHISGVKDHHKSLPREKEITGWTQLLVLTAGVWLTEAILELYFSYSYNCVAITKWLCKHLPPCERSTGNLSYVLINCGSDWFYFATLDPRAFLNSPLEKLELELNTYSVGMVSSTRVNI